MKKALTPGRELARDLRADIRAHKAGVRKPLLATEAFIPDQFAPVSRAFSTKVQDSKVNKVLERNNAFVQEERQVSKTASVFDLSPVESYAEQVARIASAFTEEDLQMLALLVAVGLSVEDISARSRFHAEEVTTILASTRFSAALLDVQRSLKVDPVAGLLATSKAQSVTTLILLRDNEGVSAKDRIAASKTLLELASHSEAAKQVGEDDITSVLAEEREIRQLLEDPSLKGLLTTNL